MTGRDFPQLIGLDLVHSDFICFGVVLDWNLGRHWKWQREQEG